MLPVPLVSVLMPAYNHGLYVRSALESVLNQTHADFELVVVDDASTDDTWQVIESIHDERLIRVRHAANQGAHASLNEALHRARGRYIAILNSDDAYAPCRLERLLAAVAEFGDAPVWAFTDTVFVDEHGIPAAQHPRVSEQAKLRSRCLSRPALAWFLTGNPAVSTSNFFFSRNLSERVGPFRPLRYTHDWDWALRATAIVAPIWIQEDWLHYRVHQSNTLSETDIWRHIHENSCVQACALRTRLESSHSLEVTERLSHDICQALLDNESLHPLSLLCFLIMRFGGVSEERLLDYVDPEKGAWLLEALARTAALPPEVFHSLPDIAGWVHALTEQRALIEERWNIIQHMNGEIAQRDLDIRARDEQIKAQASMIEERWNIIQHMSGEIAQRDRDVSDRNAQIARLEATLNRIYAHPVVRAWRYVKRKLNGGRQDDAP